MTRRLLVPFIVPIAVVSFLVTPSITSAHTRQADTIQLNGDGSSFDAPLFASAFAAYSHANPSVQVNFTADGSGAGQNNLNNGLVDFAAFDVPMLPTDNYANYANITMFPVALGGESIIYNLPKIKVPVHLTGSILAQIYMGKITSWLAPAITKLNPKLKTALKHKGFTKIIPVYRSDSSGTSYIYTNFLSATNSTWSKTYGASKLPAWPAGQGGSHSAGVDAVVKSTPGAIGYVEESYYLSNDRAIGEAYIQSKSKQWLVPNVTDVNAAASHAAHLQPLPGDFSIVYQTGKNTYPISGFSWGGMYTHQTSGAKCNAAVGLFDYETSQAQGKAGSLGYSPLPKPIQTYAANQLSTITCS